MNSNFEQSFDMRLAGSKRWLKYPKDVLPLWIADMDFALAQPIVDRLQHHIANYPLVYSLIGSQYNEVVCDYLERRHGWTVQPEWIVWTSGVVPGIYASINGFVNADQSVIVPTPIYPPFFQAATSRKSKSAPVELVDGDWRWQLPEVDDNDALLMMCNPHNPTGKVFSRNELDAIAEYCCRHDLILFSDDIYADLVLDDSKHIPIASVNEDIAQRTITLMSAGKTWNISGMGAAFAIIADEKIRSRFQRQLQGISPEPSLLGVMASCTALAECEQWRLQMLDHLRLNRRRIQETLVQIPAIEWASNQATFFAWLGCHQYDADQLWQQLFANGLALSQGRAFW